MIPLNKQKVLDIHLRRNAYLYVRQSTMKQVYNNQESTKRQYGLQEHAVLLGWNADQIIIIDDDQGKTAATSARRDGFQALSTEVSLGKAGIIIGLEVSRLARNNADWHRLLEICALTQTLILDEDGIYDPASFNDRLLLGLKGTMSEAELHILRGRLQGGIRNKAARGALKVALPLGFIYDEIGRVQINPDKQVQNIINFFFSTFKRVGSAHAVVRVFASENLKIRERIRKGPNKGEIVEVFLTFSRAIKMLRNPRYAGAFAYGRTEMKYIAGTSKTRKSPRENWLTLIKDAHAGYITWEEYETNKKKLLENAKTKSVSHKGPPREGSALLQGLAICGICGKRMHIRYHTVKGKQIPTYTCYQEKIKRGKDTCQNVPGQKIDKMIGERLIAIISPQFLEIALDVQQELISRSDQMYLLHQQQVDRASYEADLAKRRYMQTDPNNRLVAANLESDWNLKLKSLEMAQKELEQQKNNAYKELNEEKRKQILALTNNFSQLWNDPNTSDVDRKRIVRLIIEDITIHKNSEITLHIRYKGGNLETLHLPKPLRNWEQKQTCKHVLNEIDMLLETHLAEDIAKILNERGEKTGYGLEYTARLINGIARRAGLASRYERLRNRGLLTLTELTQKLGVNSNAIKKMCESGLIEAHRYSVKNEFLYSYPEDKETT